MKKKKTIDNRIFKKEGEELQQYLHFRKHGSVVENKKGQRLVQPTEIQKCWKRLLTNS